MFKVSPFHFKQWFMIRNGDIVCILISINIRKCNNRNLHSFIVNSNQRNHGINSNKFLKNYSCIKKIYCKVYYIKNKMKSQKIKRSLKRIIPTLSRFLFLENQPFFSIFPGLISKPVYLSQFMVHLYHSVQR